MYTRTNDQMGSTGMNQLYRFLLLSTLTAAVPAGCGAPAEEPVASAASATTSACDYTNSSSASFYYGVSNVLYSLPTALFTDGSWRQVIVQNFPRWPYAASLELRYVDSDTFDIRNIMWDNNQCSTSSGLTQAVFTLISQRGSCGALFTCNTASGSILPLTLGAYVKRNSDGSYSFMLASKSQTNTSDTWEYAASHTLTPEQPVASNVAIRGASVGLGLTGSYTFTGYNGASESGSTYQWYTVANGTSTAISGATSKSYTPTTDQLNSSFKFCVTPTDSYASGTQVCSSATSGYYRFTNANSSEAMDVYYNGTASGTILQQWPTNTTTAQSYKFVSMGNGYYEIVGQNSGLCADVYLNNPADGSPLQIYTCNGTGAQLWRFVSDGSGHYQVIGQTSGKCLDVQSSSTADGARLVINTCNSATTSQLWTLAPF